MLVLTRDSYFYGIIGQGTGKFVDEVEVCVGDFVKVEGDFDYDSGTNVVALFTNKYSVLGYGIDPISRLNISEIVISHKELKLHDTVCGYFLVRPMIV